MIELCGTRRERLDQAIRLAYTEVSEAELEHFRAMYRKAGIALLPAAEALYRRYGGVFRKQYLFLDDPVYNRDVYLAFYADISDSEKEILRRFDEAMQDIDQVRAFAKQELCPIGDIGFYYPACVYVGEDGLLYCVFEYKDEIEVHHEPAEILDEQLSNHLPIGLDDYPVKTKPIDGGSTYNIAADRFSLELEVQTHKEDLAYKANTNLRVKVLSDGFSAETVMDIDVRDLAEFAARLSALYETLKGSAHLKEPYGAHNSIAFFSKTGGHIAVRGRIHHQNANGDAQELTFENEIDQTFLRAFARKLFADFGGKTDHASTR